MIDYRLSSESPPNKMSSTSTPPYPVLAESDARPVRGVPIRNLRERRLGEFVGGQYAEYNLTSLLFEDYIEGDENVLRLARWDPPGESKPSFKEAVEQHYQPCTVGTTFGPSWTNHWVRLDLTIPKSWKSGKKSKEWIQLQFDPGCEAMIFDNDGLPLQGITGGGGGDRRVDFPLPASLLEDSSDKSLRLWIEVSSNGMFGVESTSEGGDPDPNRYFTLASAALVAKRPEAWKLMWDFEMLRGCVDVMPRDGPLQNKALWVANEIQNVFRKNDLASIDRCRKVAGEVLGEHWAKEEAEGRGPEVFDKQTGTPATIWAMGHCHIDSCWLWPRCEWEN